MTSGDNWWPRSDGAPPLFATRRNPLRRSDGPQVDVIARALGTPFIPWQRYVADVAGERREDGSYEYQVVVVSVPRQTGKTTLQRAVGTHRCLVCGRDVFYTAQTGKDARERWMDLVKVLQLNDALKDRVKVGLRGGSERIDFAAGGSFRVFAPTVESLHGYTPPTVMIDEAFALTAGAGELLMGAIGPGQVTIIDKQIWIVSTAGTADSTFLHDWIARAAEGMPRVGLFLWGAAEHHNPYDLDDIAAFHPGVGFELNGKTLTAGDVLEQADRNTRAEYERAYANRRTVTLSNLIPPEKWRDLKVDDLTPPTGDLVITYDVAHDRQSGSIMATWRHEAGRLVGKVIRHQAGTAWMVDAVDELVRQLRPIATAAVGNGPVLDVTAQLLDRGVDVDVLAEREYAAACGSFLSLIDDQGIGHDDDRTVLEPAVVGLVPRGAVADGVAFSRRHSVGDTSAGIAFVAGAWTLQRHESSGKPAVYFKSA
jgi:hypothetical protein